MPAKDASRFVDEAGRQPDEHELSSWIGPRHDAACAGMTKGAGRGERAEMAREDPDAADPEAEPTVRRDVRPAVHHA